MSDRSAVVAALALAYPVAFVLFRGETHCGPACVEGTGRGLLLATAVLVGCTALAVAASRVADLPERWRRGSLLGRVVDPSPAATALVVALFAGYLVLLAVEPLLGVQVPLTAVAATVAVYPFVWLLYVGTFALAIPFALAGVETGTATTVVVRTVVLVGGFGGSLVWQLLIAAAVEDAWHRR